MNIFNLLTDFEKKLWRNVSLEKDEILFRQGTVCHEVAIVSKGIIEISSYAYNGKEIIYNTIEEGGMFGNNLLFSNEPIYKGNVIGKACKNEVFLINKQDLLYIFEHNRDFLVEYLKIESDLIKELTSRVKTLSLPKVEERLIRLLHQKKGMIEFSSVSSLASFLGVERETLSRLLSSLMKKGAIKKDRHHIYLTK